MTLILVLGKHVSPHGIAIRGVYSVSWKNHFTRTFVWPKDALKLRHNAMLRPLFINLLSLSSSLMNKFLLNYNLLRPQKKKECKAKKFLTNPNPQIADHNGDAASEADAGGHRGAARRYHQAGDVHPRAARHVHGHGHARRESGHTCTLLLILYSSSMELNQVFYRLIQIISILAPYHVSRSRFVSNGYSTSILSYKFFRRGSRI